jgi:surfeit locus 1 family protein
LLLALAGAAFFTRLGFWQLDRAAEKVQLADRFEARRYRAPLDSAAALIEGQDIEDIPIRLNGRYDNSRLVYLENQPHGGRTGFHVHTVFFPIGELKGILVNRGWVPVGHDMQEVPGVQLAKSDSVIGTMATPSPLFTVGDPDYSKTPLRVGRLEIARLSEALGVELRPFIIRLDATAPDGFVRDWSPSARLGIPPQKHQAYAFQWFSLALAVLAVLFAVNLRKEVKSES